MDTPKKAKIGLNRTLISTVWLTPLLALLTGAYLLFQAVQNKGIEVTLLMDNAEGIEVNQTRIRVLNVEVGRVSHIRLNPNQKGVEVTAELKPEVAELIRKDTQFWVVKPRIDGNGVSGLATLVSGAYIAFNPGHSDEKAETFIVSSLPPVTAIGQNGLRLKLKGNSKNRVQTGSPVLFGNYEVGRVESVQFETRTQQVEYSIFIDAPNETLINHKSIFWLENGIHVHTNSAGIQLNTPPLSALLSGAIVFDTPVLKEQNTSVQNGTAFHVYENRAAVDALPDVRSLYFVVFFKQSIRGLQVGAPVEYKGLSIGQVADVPYFQNGDSLKIFQNGWVPVRIRIDPNKLEHGAPAQSQDYWQKHIEQSIQKGLMANLTNHNLILGSKMIELSDAHAHLPSVRPTANYGGWHVIASQGGGLEDLQAQVSQLLNKFNSLPLEQTVQGLNGNLNQLQQTLSRTQNVLKSAEEILNQTQAENLPQTVNQSLKQLQEVLQSVAPQSPVYREAQQVLQNLNATLNEAKPLVQTLKEQPDALIFNRNHADPVPKGKLQ